MIIGMERELTKCYAVVSGEYSDYAVHAIYRRREDAEVRCETNNSTPSLMVDGVPTLYDEIHAQREIDAARRGISLSEWWHEHVEGNPAREELDDLRVEEFDYYEGEPLPAALEER